eukprot:1067569-Prorocentrum_minimum.AAC.1
MLFYQLVAFRQPVHLDEQFGLHTARGLVLAGTVAARHNRIDLIHEDRGGSVVPGGKKSEHTRTRLLGREASGQVCARRAYPPFLRAIGARAEHILPSVVRL